MNVSIVFLRSAEQDLKELKAYLLRNFGNDTWQSSYSQIKTAVNALKTFPQQGCTPEELLSLNLTQYRQIIVGMNRIIYEQRQDSIYIHIVCDTRKDMLSMLTRRLLRDF